MYANHGHRDLHHYVLINVLGLKSLLSPGKTWLNESLQKKFIFSSFGYLVVSTTVMFIKIILMFSKVLIYHHHFPLSTSLSKDKDEKVSLKGDFWCLLNLNCLPLTLLRSFPHQYHQDHHRHWFKIYQDWDPINSGNFDNSEWVTAYFLIAF